MSSKADNTTSTGGILIPHPQPPALVTTPPNLSFIQFIQQLLVGLSEFPGPMVRPEWQKEPPKQPDIDTNWLAFGMTQAAADFNAYVTAGTTDDPNPSLQRNELIPISISVYGPKAYDNIGLIRDGFQLTQNLQSLRKANIGFAMVRPLAHGDLSPPNDSAHVSDPHLCLGSRHDLYPDGHGRKL